MMNKVFAWPVMMRESFKCKALFSYGSTQSSESITEWASIYEDLVIELTVSSIGDAPDPAYYTYKGEKLNWLLCWKGDDKFSGVSQLYDYKQESQVLVKATIPKGYCFSSFELECNLISILNGKTNPFELIRPIGSIIVSLTVLDGINIGKGKIFPLTEYRGDGKALIHWDFSTTDDLDIAVSSGVMALIDKNHPFSSDFSKNQQADSLIMIMLIQSFTRKAFNKEIFEQLNEKIEKEEVWRKGSLGASFMLILKKIVADLNLLTIIDLHKTYIESPEIIDESIFRIFSGPLNNRINV